MTKAQAKAAKRAARLALYEARRLKAAVFAAPRTTEARAYAHVALPTRARTITELLPPLPRPEVFGLALAA